MIKAQLIFIMILMGICGLIGGFLWPYTLETWALFFNKDITIVFWQGALLGFCPIIGQSTIPVAIATWILMLFLI